MEFSTKSMALCDHCHIGVLRSLYVLSCFHCVHPQLYTVRPQLRSLHPQLPSLRSQLPSLRFQLPSLSFQLCLRCVLSSLYCVLKHKNKMAVVDKRLSVAFPHDLTTFQVFLGCSKDKRRRPICSHEIQR